MEELSDKSLAGPKNLFIIGTQTGDCPICKKTKTLLILRFGLTLCNECLLVCMNILENLQYGVTKESQRKNSRIFAQGKKTSKVTQAEEKTNRITQSRIPKTTKKRESK